jgi:hypothetical protein
MAVKTLTTALKNVPKYPNQPLAANSLDFVFEAPDVAADGVIFPATGREIVLLQNTAVGAQTFSIVGIRQSTGHVQDLLAYSMAAGEFAVLPAGLLSLYGSATGQVTITMSDVGIKVAVIQVPNPVA